MRYAIEQRRGEVRLSLTGLIMKTRLTLCFLAASFAAVTLPAQTDSETDSVPLPEPAPAVTYQAPVVYEAPVVYQAPVVYEAPVVYQSAVSVQTHPAYCCRATSVVRMGAFTVYSRGCRTGYVSPVIYFGRDQASQGYQFNARR